MTDVLAILNGFKDEEEEKNILPVLEVLEGLEDPNKSTRQMIEQNSEGFDQALEGAVEEDEADKMESSFWWGRNPAMEFGSGFAEGMQETLNEFSDFLVGEDFNPEAKFDIEEPETSVEAIGTGFGKIAVGLAPGATITKLSKVAQGAGWLMKAAGFGNKVTKSVQAMVAANGAGIIAEQLVFDPSDPIISNIVEENPELSNAITQALATDPNDPEYINRLRMAVEGSVVGSAAGAVLGYFGRQLARSERLTSLSGHAKELTGLGDSPRAKQHLAEEYLENKTADASKSVRDALVESDIDTILETVTKRKASDVYAEVRKDPQAIERVLSQQVLENNGMDVKVAKHNVRKWQDEGRLPEVIRTLTGKSSDEWVAIAKQTPEALETPAAREALGGVVANKPKKLVGSVSKLSEYARSGLVVESLQRNLLGYGAHPVELRKAFKEGKTFLGRDLAKSPAVMHDQLQNKIMSNLQRVVEDGVGNPTLPSRIDAASAIPEEYGGRSLGAIFKNKSVDDISEFMDYMHREVAATRFSKKGIDSPLLADPEFQTKLDSARSNPEIQRMAQEYRNLGKGMLMYAHRSGIIGTKDVRNIIKAYTNDDGVYNYTPTFVDIDHKAARPFVSKGNGFKEVKGNADVPLMDPLEAIVQYAGSTIHKAEVNLAKQSFYDLHTAMTRSVDGNTANLADDIATRVDLTALSRNKKLKSEFRSALARELRKNTDQAVEENAAARDLLRETQVTGKTWDDMDLEELLEHTPAMKSLDVGRDTYDVVFYNGEPRVYKINDPDLKSAMENLGQHAVAEFTKGKGLAARTWGVMKGTARIQSTTITHTPGFFIPMAIKDSMTAAINSAHGFVPIASSIKGLYQSYSNPKMYQEMANAAATGATRTETIGKLSRIANKNSYLGRVLNAKGTKTFQKVIDELPVRLEMSTRVASYQLAKKEGMSPELAALYANEISVNFVKKGSSKALNTFSSTVPFMNAGIQAAVNTGRSIVFNSKKFGMWTAAYMAYDLMFSSASEQYPEYSLVDEVTRATTTVIPNYLNPETALDDLKAGRTPALDPDMPFIPLPIPFGGGTFGKLFSSVMQDGFNEKTRANVREALIRSTSELLPTGGLPTFLSMATELATNSDNFGREIKPGFLDSTKHMEKLYTSSTGDFAIAVSEFSKKLDGMLTQGEGEAWVHPVVMDYLLRSATPGVLRYVKNVADSAASSTDRTTSALGATSKSDNPLEFLLQDAVKKFMIHPSEMRGGAQAIYKLKKKAFEFRTARKAEQRNMLMSEIATTYRTPEGLEESLEMASPYLAHFSNFMRTSAFYKGKITNDPTLTGDEKRVRIDELIADENRKTIRLLESLNRLDINGELRKATK